MADGPFDSEPERTDPQDTDILPLQDPGANSDHHITWGTIKSKTFGENQREALNDTFVAIARLQFEHSLDELAYDGGFFDIFRDESKIASKTDVVVSTLDGGDANGKVELAQEDLSNVVDGDTVTRTNDNATRNESYVGGVLVNPNQELQGVTCTLSANISGHTTAYLKLHSDGSTIASQDISSLTAGETFTFSEVLASGTEYRLVVDAGGSSYTMGHGDGNFSSQTSADIDMTHGLIVGTKQTGDAYNIVSVTARVFEQGFKDGNYVSSVFDLGFMPSSCVLSQDADIAGDEDIQYTLDDGNGNTVTIAQADVDTEVDVSALSDQTVTVKPALSTTDKNTTPTLRSLALHFLE